MGVVSVTTFSSDTETVTRVKLNGLASNLVTEFNGSIDNDNIDASAGILGSKLNLAASGVIGSGTPAAGTFTTLTGTTVDGIIGSVTPAAGTFTSLSASTTLGITGLATFSGGITETIADDGDVAALTVIQNDVTNNGNCTVLTNTGTGACLTVNQDGNGYGLDIDTEATSTYGLRVKGQNTSGTMVHFENEGNQASGILATMIQQHASSAANILNLVNDGTGNGLFVDQNGNGIALSIDSEATTVNCVTIAADTLTTASALQINSASADTSARNLLDVNNSNVAADAVICVRVNNVGDDANLLLANSGNGAHIRFTGDPGPSSVDGDFWFNGTELFINVGGTTYSLDKTST